MSAFDKVIGYEKEKDELFQLCDMARNPGKYARLGVQLPHGVLLHGVPGVGKTLMATALVEEMARKTFVLRKDKSIQDFVDEIGKTFARAKEEAPSVILLDDLDKFASDSDSRNPEELIAVQSGIDAVRSDDVFVVATANELRELPHSLRRPGRFDRILEICPPNRREAAAIVRHYLQGKKVAQDVSAESVARLMDGNSCASLESVQGSTRGMKEKRKSAWRTSCAQCSASFLRRRNRSMRCPFPKKKRSPSTKRAMPWRRSPSIPRGWG